MEDQPSAPQESALNLLQGGQQFEEQSSKTTGNQSIEKVIQNNQAGSGTGGKKGYVKRAQVMPLTGETKSKFFAEKEFVYKFGIATEVLCRLGYDSNNKV